MTLTFQLDENDYLQYNLFFASKNQQLKRTWRTMWISVSVVMASACFIFFKNHDYVFTSTFAVLFIAVIFFYPAYMHYRYRDRLKKMLHEQYRSKPDKAVTVTFIGEGIEIANANSLSKFVVSELQKVFETGDYIYMMFVSGSFFIPKTKIANADDTSNKLKAIAEKVKAEYYIELNWKWK